ncbi:zinc metalloprotease HtpX [Candidatus Woesearchaeota archaeon]|nr:zinc metalloprotease HtpX [Candidatus Woesearchaeota archaeon]
MKNQLKTVLLLGLLTGLLLGAGQLLGGRQGLFIGLAIALVMNFGSYWFSDKIVLAMYKAKPVKKDHKLYSIVKKVAEKAGMPMPKVYIIPTDNPNAFATGRNPKHAAVACTAGILNILDKEELKGVLAHEMGHVKNRDILISTIAATIAGVISYLAFFARWGAIFGGFGGDRNDGGNLISLLVLAIITPIIATIIQLAISRSREFLADETGAKIMNDPKPLASALKKLEQSSKMHPLKQTETSKATAHLFIVNPFKGKNVMNLFMTHPTTEARVKRLNNMEV